MNNSYPISPFKALSIVDLGFMCQQLVERVRTFLSLNVTILRLYLLFVTKYCFILPESEVLRILHLFGMGPALARDAGDYIGAYQNTGSAF